MKFLLFIYGFIMLTTASAQSSESQYEEIKIVTTDVDSFWKAFDTFKKDTSANPFIEYIANGTEALKHVLKWNGADNPQAFKKFISKEIAYYESIRPFCYDLLKHKDAIKRYVNNFKLIYPSAENPAIYAVVGKAQTGATAFEKGLVIGTELFGESSIDNTLIKPTPTRELPVIIATALIFYHNKPAYTGHTLLRQSIILGSAEFIASLIVEEQKDLILKKENYLYGELYEETLVKEFLREKDNTDFGNWLYQKRGSGKRPANLGCWFGYKVTEAYYNNATNKTKAIDEILKINNFDMFLQLSGYAVPFMN